MRNLLLAGSALGHPLEISAVGHAYPVPCRILDRQQAKRIDPLVNLRMTVRKTNPACAAVIVGWQFRELPRPTSPIVSVIF